MKHFSENEVTIESLIDAFESAFIKIKDKNDDSFKVQGENLFTTVTNDEGRKFLSLRIVYSLSNITLSEATHISNKVNSEYIFIRFSSTEYEGDVFMESRYYMTYEEGLIVFQLINMVKKFEKYTVDALREYFSDYI